MTPEDWEKTLRLGFAIAVDYAEVSEHDGWQRTAPAVDFTEARKQLEDRVKRKGSD